MCEPLFISLNERAHMRVRFSSSFPLKPLHYIADPAAGPNSTLSHFSCDSTFPVSRLKSLLQPQVFDSLSIREFNSPPFLSQLTEASTCLFFCIRRLWVRRLLSGDLYVVFLALRRFSFFFPFSGFWGCFLLNWGGLVSFDLSGAFHAWFCLSCMIIIAMHFSFELGI